MFVVFWLWVWFLCVLEVVLGVVMRVGVRCGYSIVFCCLVQKYGTEFWRPALFAMLAAVQQGRVNVVMVQSLARLRHDITTLYRILRILQNYGAVLITTETNLQYELYLTGLERRILARTARTGKRVPWVGAVDADWPVSRKAGTGAVICTGLCRAGIRCRKRKIA